MTHQKTINDIADVCLKLKTIVDEYGNNDIKFTTRLLLFQVGQEITRHELEYREKRLLKINKRIGVS